MNVLVLEEKSKRLLNKTSGGGKIAKWIATVVNLEDDTLLTISSFDEKENWTAGVWEHIQAVSIER